MKKLITFVLICNLQFAICNLTAQGLLNMQHYYSYVDYSSFWDRHNFIQFGAPEELVFLDKATMSYTRIPYPDSIRYLNNHNTYYTDSSGFGYTCEPHLNAYAPPGNSSIVLGCHGEKYIFDGTSWSSFTSYLGYSSDSIYFTTYGGGSVFFQNTNGALVQWDGSTQTVFDSTNSPLAMFNVWGTITTPNDNIITQGPYEVYVYHGGVWNTYDTTFFHTDNISLYPNAVSPLNDFAFYSSTDTLLNIFKNTTGIWDSVHVPIGLFHSLFYGAQLSSTSYDMNGNLWLSGDSTLMMYDGVLFHDYFSYVASALGIYGFQTQIYCQFYNHSFLMNNNLVFDYNSLTVSPLVADQHQMLFSNEMVVPVKDGGGNIWFGTYTNSSLGQAGLTKYDGTTLQKIVTLPFVDINGGIHCMAKDTGTSIVFGGDVFDSHNGPVITDGSTFNFVDTNYNWSAHTDAIAVDTAHHYWFGGYSVGALQESYAGATTFHGSPATGSQELWALCIDSLNNKWCGYYDNLGAWVFNGSSWINYNTSNSPLPSDSVACFLMEPNTNIVWICTNNGFAKYHNGNWSVINMANSPIPSNQAEYVFKASDGTYYFCTMNGIATFNGSSWQVYTTFNSPLFNSDIEGMEEDNNCTLWITTDKGLITAVPFCGYNSGMVVSGNVTKSDNSIVPNVPVLVYKLNNSATDVIQKEYLFADINGHYTYYTTDTGTYFFRAEASAATFSGQISSYSDSSLVVQNAVSLHVTGAGNATMDIRLKQQASNLGGCTFKGKLYSINERTGNVRLILMLNNDAVATTVSNADGSFYFADIAPGAYQIWVDKYGLNNGVAPLVNISCPNISTLAFDLFADHLSVSDLGFENNIVNNSVTVYPNPTTGTLRISDFEFRIKEIKISNLLGELVQQSKITSPQFEISVDISGVANGIYFIQIKDEKNNVVNKKVVKQ